MGGGSWVKFFLQVEFLSFARWSRVLCHGAQAAPTHKGHQGESGADITPQNGTTSISLTEGFKPFEEVRPSRIPILSGVHT